MRSVLLVGCLLFAFIVSPISAQEERELPSLEVISTENAGQLQEIGMFGRGAATALDWHPDGEALAVGSATGVWLLDENLQILEHTPIQQDITDLAWSPDGTRIAVVSHLRDRCTVQVWDVDFTAPELTTDYCGRRIQWNTDSRYLAIFNFNPTNNEVLLIDVIENEVTTLSGQDGAWSPSGDILFTRLRYSWTYTDIPTLYTWDMETKETLFALDITDNQSGNILWGIDDRSLAVECTEYDEETDRISLGICSLSAHTGETALLHEITSVFLGQCICFFRFDWNDNETLLAYVYDTITPGFLSIIGVMNSATRNVVRHGDIFDWKPQSDELTTIVGNGKIRTYEASTGVILAENHFFTAPINMISIRPGSEEIASAVFGYNQDTLIWKLSGSPYEPRLSFYVEPAEVVDYTPNGDELIAGGLIGTDIVINQNVIVVDPDTGEYIRGVEGFYDQGASPLQRYWSVDYQEYAELDNNRLLLSNGVDIEIENNFLFASWSPDGAYIATVTHFPNDYSFEIRTWNTPTGDSINVFAGGMFAFRGLVWSPDSMRIAVLLEHPTGSNVYLRGFRVFTVAAGDDYLFDRSDHEIFTNANIDITTQQTKAAWNSDGTMLAVVLHDRLEIHAPQGDGTPLLSLPAYEISDLEWSGDDRFIAAGSADGTVRIWGVPSGE